jgi:hypothetical protein
MEAKKLGEPANYAPVIGAEHCPVCWVREGALSRLRLEHHHNADRVMYDVCDSCGLVAIW